MKKNVLFRSGSNNFNSPVVVITGACRSGKTLLGNLLATCPEVEYADEPWTGMVLPMAVDSGKIEKEFASSIFSAYFFELFCDLILLRRANFRRKDLSSIWTKKTAEEIDLRLNKLGTRGEVLTFLKSNNSTLLVTLSECAPFADFILAALNHAQMIHVVRNPFDVAWDVLEKKWFSDEQLLSPLNATLYSAITISRQTWYLPWWVNEGEEEFFVKLSDYERSLYYWCSLMDKGLEAFQSCESKEILVLYENLVSHTEHEFNRVISYLGFTRGKLADQMIEGVKSNHKERITPKIDKNILDWTNELNRKIGVSCEHSG